MTRILNQHQARAVVDAMCALNNVHGSLACRLGDTVSVEEVATGVVIVRCQEKDGVREETHADQGAFMLAYEI